MNKLVKGICVAAFACFLVTAFVAAAEDPGEKEIKKLIIKRTDVMESVLFGKITYEEGCSQLKEIETGSLFSEDVERLAENRQTDLTKTEKIEFISIEEKTSMYDKRSYIAQIRWTESYGMERSTHEYVYDVGAQIEDEKYKLTTFEIQ